MSSRKKVPARKKSARRPVTTPGPAPVQPEPVAPPLPELKRFSITLVNCSRVMAHNCDSVIVERQGAFIEIRGEAVREA
jgi:hypothetical protein